MNLSQFATAAAVASLFGFGSASATSNAGNVTAQGSGSCSAITGTFPAFAASATINGELSYLVTILITPKGGTLQTVEDVFNTSNGTLESIDTQLFGITSGTYSGAIAFNSFGVLVLGSTGTSSGTRVVLTTPVSGQAACVITLFGQLFFTG